MHLMEVLILFLNHSIALQYGSAVDLSLLLLDSLDTSKAPVTEKLIGKYIRLIWEYFSTPSSVSQSIECKVKTFEV